jgi:hypothetical protein
MLYLDATQDAQRVFIPRTTDGLGELRLELRSTVNLDTVVNAVVYDVLTSAQYYVLAVVLPADAVKGEYRYTLTAGGKAVATGLAVVGDYGASRVQYDNIITYEQYQ